MAELSLAPGAIIENLRIDRILGQGAFGVTYLVTDQLLSKSFALKEYLPRDHVSRSEDSRLQPKNEASASLFASGLEHFLEEGRRVAQLKHPNIVEVFRCFEANGTAYLLMPYYRGEALHTLLKRSGVFSVEEALALARPMLDALEYIHSKGLVHQDIKPANIYITDTGQPILLDFGAAGQRLDAAASTRWKLGSEGYAAPEQSEHNGSIGPWTDIYGLAATLYRCISGQIPVAAAQRQSAVAEGEADPLEPVANLVPAQPYSSILKAIESGLRLQPAARPRDVAGWRPVFGRTAAAGPGAGNAAIEQEGREWLPIILLSILGIVLLSAVIYLLAGGDGKPADPEDGRTPPSAGTDQQAEPTRVSSPEETTRWQSALELDTAYGYQLFMHDFPDSIHREQAEMHLEQLDDQAWGYARQQNTPAAVAAYMDTFLSGKHEAEARILMDEFRLAADAAQREMMELERQDDEAWEKARADRTIGAINQYLSDWAGGRHDDEARTLRRQIQAERDDTRAFEAAGKLDTIDAYKSYVAAFPAGRHVARALEAIDDRTLRPGKKFRDCEDCPSMVVVPAGSFWQGSEETAPLALKMETPRRMVTIAEPFAAGVFEITMAQWDQCVADGGCKTRPPDNGWGRSSRPAIMVSWNDTQEFTAWLSRKTGQSYSLPSESQWEYIARAGEESDWLGGSAASVCQFGNIAGSESGFRWQHEECADQAAIETLPVGSFRANAFGVYDVIGNVAEWTLDCMNLSYLDAPANGSAWGRGICSSRMTRGGSWFTGSREVRLPARFNLKNGDRNDFTGFRVVRRVEPQ
ncbi:MAG: SUMF1/EgtB/PvdO family nonheme iron enzyme [Gammaproteobacteria bacterium]|nr:SUMF1/EgtB/PvdO family nonheme iron enzyme [Gammaproteobacteria bacterium]